MKKTYVVRTTGFDRSEFDVGYELFAIDLGKRELEHLLRLIQSAKQVAHIDRRFQFLVFKDKAGRWLPKNAVPEETISKMQVACDSDTDLLLDVRAIKGMASEPDGGKFLFIKPRSVFWGCNAAFNDADWLIETTEISEAKLQRMAKS